MANYNLGTASGEIVLKYDGGAASKAQGDLKKVGDSSSGAGESASRAGTVIGLAGAAIAGGIGAAVKSAADFQAKMSGVQAVSGASGKEMQQLSQLALQLGQDTKYNATQAAGAIEELVKAGVSVPDVMNGAAKATTDLAAAGEISLPQAATIAANAMNGFGLSGQQMPHVADLIAGAANASAIDVGQFGQSLSQVAAVAHLTGLSFDDTSVAIAEMGNAGIKGSDAGTSLKTFLQNLIPTTDAQTTAMQKMGLIAVSSGDVMGKLAKEGIKPASDSFNDIITSVEKYNKAQGGANVGTVKAKKDALATAQSMGVVSNQFFDASGNVKKLSDVQAVLQKSTKGMTKEQKLQTLGLLFGSDAIRGAAVLSDAGAKGYDKMSKAMSKVSAADVAAQRMNNLKGSIEQLKGSLETVMITIGTALLPVLKTWADRLTDLVNKFGSLSPKTQELILKIALITAGALLFAAGLIKITKFVGDFSKSLKAIGTLLKANPWVLLATVIIAVGVALYELYQRSETFRNIVQTVFGFVQKYLGAFFGWLKGLWATYGPYVVDGAKTAFEAVKTFIVAAIPVVKQAVADIIAAGKVVFSAIAAFWAKDGATIVNVVKTYIGYVVTTVRNLITIIKGIWNILHGLFTGDWNQLWQGLKQVVTAVWSQIVAYVKLATTLLLAAFQLIGPLLLKLWGLIWDGIKKLPGLALDLMILAVKTSLKLLYSQFVTLPTMILKALGGLAVLLAAKGVELIAGLLWGVVSKLTPFFAYIAAIPGNIVKFIGSLATTLTQKGADLIYGLYSAAVNYAQTFWGWIRSIPGLIVKGIGALGNLLVSRGKDLIYGLYSAAVNFYLNMGVWLRALPGNIAKAVGNLAKLLASRGKDLIYGLYSAAVNYYVNMGAWLRALPKKIASAVGTLAQTLYSRGVNVIHGLYSGAVGAIGQVSSFMSGIPSRIGGWIGSLASLLYQRGIDLLHGLYSGATAGVSQVSSWLSGLPGKVKGWVGDLGAVLYAAGVALLKGLYNGIISGFYDAYQWLASLPSKVAGWVGDLGGALYNAGAQLVQGLINGIESKISSLRSKVSSVLRFAHIPGNAQGGDVTAGNLSMVGENGPELFVPNVNGRIVTHAQTMAMMAQAQRMAMAGANSAMINAPVRSRGSESLALAGSGGGAASTIIVNNPPHAPVPAQIQDAMIKRDLLYGRAVLN